MQDFFSQVYFGANYVCRPFCATSTTEGKHHYMNEYGRNIILLHFS